MNKHVFLNPQCAAAILLVGPVTVTALAGADSTSPDTVHMTGLVRDFHQNHPDMEREPEHGFGLYTGNLELELGEDGKPVFTGNGAKVTKNFRDAENRPIAPHLYNRKYECEIGMPEDECVTLSHPSAGNNPPSVYEVCFLGVDFNEDGTSTWRYRISEVQGTALSHWTLWLHPSVDVMEGTTDGWTWVGDDHPNFPGPGIKWNTNGGVGSSGKEFVIVLGDQYVGKNDSWVQAKGGGGTQYAITPVFGPSENVSTTGTPFQYTWWGPEPDPSLGDQQGEFGEAGTGGIDSAESFDDWFKQKPEINVSLPITINLVNQGDGVYVFDSQLDDFFSEVGGFFPVDETLFGNAGNTHNYHFTFEVHGNFTYQPGQFFRAYGDDDIWVFVDDRLVIDLGGVHAPVEQYIDLDRLCLVPGQEYSISIFHAQRHRTESNFRIETDVEVDPGAKPTVTAMFD